MITFVIVEPETPGNIGAIARTMKNFGFEDLVLINPQTDHLSEECRNRAKHAQEILENAKSEDFKILDSFDYLVGTTAQLGTDYNIPRSPINPKQLAEKLAELDSEKSVAILIGREGPGLTNEEINRCDFIATIPSSKTYPTLNISHAVSIIAYELFQLSGKNKTDEHFIAASKVEKGQLLKMVNDSLENMEFDTPEKKETQQIVWKRLFGKAMLTKREAYALMGFFRKLYKQPEDKEDE